jgi:maleate isomerase
MSDLTDAGSSPQRPGITFDAGRHDRARLGFVLLAMEQTVADDMFTHAPPGVGVHFTRAAMANAVTVENLEAMHDGLGPAAAMLLPEGQLDVVCYACTSGSVVMGEDRVIAALQSGHPNAKATTLVTGVIRALNTLDAKRIVVATPYLDEVNRIESDYLIERGFDVLDITGLNLTDDADMARVSPAYIRDFALELDRSDAQAIFVSCGALRSVDVIDEIEQRSGKPVVVSNQAMLWNCLRMAGINDPLPRLGYLCQHY